MPVMEMRAVRHLTLCCLTKKYAVLLHTRNACEQEEQNHTVWAVSHEFKSMVFTISENTHH